MRSGPPALPELSAHGAFTPTMPNPSSESPRDRDDLKALAQRADLASLVEAIDHSDLDAALLHLRKEWLAKAHRPADATLKSPCEGDVPHMPGGEGVPFGYERELGADMLEDRIPLCYPVPAGWQSVRILCRSGQAALSSLLHLIVHKASSADGAASHPLKIHHAGRYFETASLLGLWPRQLFEPVSSSEKHVDVLIGEPVHCDGQFGLSNPASLPRARQALLLDTTLTSLELDLPAWLARLEGSFAAVLRSGLKLDQAGLELANVGIIQLFVREGAECDAASMGEELKHIRALTGSGLTLDEMAALSAPWFLDRSYLAQYTARVFANNAALAQAIGSTSSLFDGLCHPSLISPGAVAPFCAIRLRTGEPADHVRLLHRVEDEIVRRKLKLDKGGSFGFRGDRYELIEPDPEAGQPFLRVAMGYRGGANCDAIIDLFHELAALPGLP